MTAHMQWRSIAAMLALAGAAATAHAAESYPARPIRLIVPFPPGGSADPLARAFGAWFADKFGVSVVADNRPGAGTAIAHTLAARAPADGYTLILGASSGLSTNPAFGTRLDYDPVKDFEPVGLAAYVPQLLVVHPEVAAKNIKELIELSKVRSNIVNFGSPGAGSVGHLSVVLINTTTGAKFLHVPYKGAGPATIDLIAGRIHAFLGSVTGTQPHIVTGKMRALATGHSARLRAMPDLPTIAESLPGFTNDGWYGLFGPAGTPAPVVTRLNAEMKQALANTAFNKHIESIGMVPAGSTPQALGEWVRSELARWSKAVHDAGIQAQGKPGG